MGRFIYSKTENCCKCYSKAIYWNGWLIKSRDGIVAGFCESHKPNEERKHIYNKDNLRGIYNKQMGEIFKKNKTKLWDFYQKW